MNSQGTSRDHGAASIPSSNVPAGQFQGSEIEPGTFHVRLVEFGLPVTGSATCVDGDPSEEGEPENEAGPDCTAETPRRGSPSGTQDTDGVRPDLN